MKIIETKIKGAYIVQLEEVADDRGYFARSFCSEEFKKAGLDFSIAQANISFNKKAGTLRGLHYQIMPYQESKLVRCTLGAIFDVIVDLRADSGSFKQWFGINLTARSRRSMYIPEGCAHGYLALADNSMVQYFVSNFYCRDAERTIRWDTSSIGIKWPAMEKYIISEKDRNANYI